MMRYFKENSTNEIFVYSPEDLNAVSHIQNETPDVFNSIAERLKGMVELTDQELDLHLNPPPSAEQIRSKRDSLLRQVDAYSAAPLRWSNTSPEDQLAIAEYRQLLLDVPQQHSFPDDILWPKMPSILSSERI